MYSLESNFDNSIMTNDSTSYYDNALYEPYRETVRQYYPVYYPMWETKNSSLEQAFKILQVLIEKKLIKITTVKQFIETVNEISGII